MTKLAVVALSVLFLYVSTLRAEDNSTAPADAPAAAPAADATTAATTAAAAAAGDAKPAEGEAQADHKPADSEQKVSGQQLEDHGAHDAASKDAVPAAATVTETKSDSTNSTDDNPNAAGRFVLPLATVAAAYFVVSL
ncbi:hypothetical protein AAVH_30794 [Aphelenchoides avenae]|nr:hypothetical protein AAVH_30794 [Aphelenchus avenae]